MSDFEGEEYEVIYDWEPENDEDLRLVAGDIILVIQKNEHGWWYGVTESMGKGYFPKNYVKVKMPVQVINAPKPPPRPESMAITQKVLESEGVSKLTLNVTESSAQPNSPRNNTSNSGANSTRTFSVKSLKAFDDLTDRGFAVEVDMRKVGDTNSGKEHIVSTIQPGMKVDLFVSAMIWDGASTDTKEFAKGNLTFYVGKRQVTPGLDAAMLELSVGDIATVTCTPSKAYGAAGNPPSVPPNAFIVYKLEVISASAATESNAPVGPSSLLGTGIATSHARTAHAKAIKKVILVSEDEDIDNEKEDMVQNHKVFEK